VNAVPFVVGHVHHEGENREVEVMQTARRPAAMWAVAQRPADEPAVIIDLLQFNADGVRVSYLRYTQQVRAKSLGGTPLSSSSIRHRRRSSTW
jgi:hypothetical protein